MIFLPETTVTESLVALVSAYTLLADYLAATINFLTAFSNSKSDSSSAEFNRSCSHSLISSIALSYSAFYGHGVVPNLLVS